MQFSVPVLTKIACNYATTMLSNFTFLFLLQFYIVRDTYETESIFIILSERKNCSIYFLIYFLLLANENLGIDF